MKKLIALALTLIGVSAWAETIAVSGGTLSYTGAQTAKTVDGDVVLTFTNSAGTITVPSGLYARARVFAVAGGGAGGTMAAKDELGRGAAGGGGAGGVSDRSVVLDPGTYTMEIGKGARFVDTYVTSVTGVNGGNTSLVGPDGSVISMAKGGGGGGTVSDGAHGENGGSGGGGSWYGVYLAGGGAVDGQGWKGGTPTNVYEIVTADDGTATTNAFIRIGGGGGGASTNAVAGSGGADGHAGAGRESDITGEMVVYGQGGRGGRRGDASYVAVDGAGYGFGGDGAAATGPGGAGGDGILIVRIEKLFTYTKVKYPTYVTNHTWTAGSTYTVFDADNISDATLKAGLAAVKGVTTTNASVTALADGTVVTNGLGRFFFALQLKDEYRWDDGSANGSDNTPVFYWNVQEPGTVGQTTIDVTKTVEWSEGTNAVIAIDVHSTPEKIENIPNVLVLGSLCDKHGFDSDIAKTALNTITKVANVDYYFFDKGKTDPTYSGSLLKGEQRTAAFTMTQSNHGVIYGFYNKIAELIDAGKFASYDYVVFAFDRTQVATFFTSGNHAREAEVSAALKPLYDKDAVIWLVDNGKNGTANSYSATGGTVVQYPWFPTILVWARESNWYSLGNYETTYGGNSTTPHGYNSYKALMGMFAPAKYETLATSDDYGSRYNTLTYANIMDLGAPDMTNTPQCVYANADDVEHLLEAVVKAKPSTLRLQDDICVSMGLDLAGATGTWTTNETTMGWRTLTANELVTTTNGVTIALPGIQDEAWIKLKLKVADTGAFRTSANAVYNEKTGQWEKDPNNGPVNVSVTPDGGQTVLAQASASTAVAWSFPTYKIRGEILYGKGEIALNGFVMETIDVAEGTSPKVVYRGKGGYVVDYLEIDGQVITDFDPDSYSWLFSNVAADHLIRVGFKSVFTVPYPETAPVTNLYDGTAYAPTITPPTFIEGYDYAWKAAYSLESNGVYTVDGGQVNVVYDENGNVTSTNVYCRVWIDQPGYENGVVLDDWTGVNTVTILPRPLTVTFDDYAQTTRDRKDSGFTYDITAGSLVEGDTLDVDAGQCISYPEKGAKTEDSITALGDMHVTTPDYDGCNYTITVVPGDYYYPEQELVAKAANVSKPYDGVATSIVVTVIYPEGIDLDNMTVGETVYSDWVEAPQNEWTETSSGSGNKKTYTQTKTRTRTATQITSASVEYSVDGGTTWTTTKPEYTDADSYTVMYRVACSVKTWTETQSATRTKRYSWWSSGDWGDWDDWGDTVKSNETLVDYDPYTGSAVVTITKRPVVVTAGSAEKMYDGTALTQASYTVADATETTGFIAGEGFASVTMTAGSTRTVPGSTENEIDAAALTYNANTKAENYSVTCVAGKLVITENALTVTATGSEKTYDGQPADKVSVTVVDKDGKTPTGVTIQYTVDDGATWTTTPPTITDAGTTLVKYRVNGGAGYGGSQEGVVTVKVNPRAVTLKAADATKTYDGTALTETGFTVVDGGDGFAAGEGISAVTMTDASTITKPGTTANVIDTADTANWTFTGGAKAQNYTFTVQSGTLTVDRRLVYEVDGDGEFTWTMDGGKGETITVVVDGKYTNQVYVAGGDSPTNHVMHVSDEATGDGATHTIEFIIDTDDGSLYPDNVDWTPSATRNELYSVVDTDPPSENIEKLQENITITNGVESGWMPVYGTNEDGTVNTNEVVGITTPDGTEGDGKGGANSSTNTSTFGMGVVGTGELRIESITVPIKDETNVDGGALTITVDGKTYEIPPVTDEDVSYTITTNNGMVVISNLVIKVSGDSDTPHDVTFTYTRGADNLTTNTAATVTHIVWATYGETDDGGTSWLQAKQLAIIDHETLANGWVYLAFEPRLKVTEELKTWVARSAKNEKIQVKYGATREACETCLPIVAELSDRHPVLPVKVWIRVEIAKVPGLQDTATGDEAVGFWRVYVAPSVANSATNATETASATVQAAEPAVASLASAKAATLLSDEAEPTTGDTPATTDATTDPAAESGAESVNVFGVIKVESVTTNTMISIPWTWYSWEEHEAQDIPVRKLVKTTNLTEGDLIYGSVGNGRTYNAWVLETVTNTVELADGTTNTISYLDWVPSLVVRETGDGLGTLEMTCDEDDDIPDASYSKSTRVARGNGLWLHRQNPVDKTGNAIPFWIYGQSVTTAVETVIYAPTGTNTVWSTMVGNPYSMEVNLNKDITFLDADGNATTPDTRDHIWYYTDDGKTRIATYRAGKGWYIVIPKVINGRLYQANSFNVKIPLGRAFWYDRRGATDLKIKWTKPTDSTATK